MPVAFDDLIPAATEKKSVSFDDLVPAEKKPVAFDDLIPPDKKSSDAPLSFTGELGAGHYLNALAVGLDKARNIGTEAVSSISPELSARIFGQTTESLRPNEIAPPIIPPEAAKQIIGQLPAWAGGNTPFGQGASESAANALSSFSSPGALAQLPAFALPGVAETYALNTLHDLPDQGKRLLETANQYGWGSKETGQLAAEYGITDLTGFLAGKHGTLARGIKREINAKAGEVPSIIENRPEQPIQLRETATPPSPSTRPESEIPPAQIGTESPQPEITIPVDERQAPSAPSDNPAMARFQGDVSAAPNPEPQPASDATGQMEVKLGNGDSFTIEPGKSISGRDVFFITDSAHSGRSQVNTMEDALSHVRTAARARRSGIVESSVPETPSVPNATEANSALGKPNETVSSTERPIGEPAPTGETLGGSDGPPSSAPGAAVGAEPVRAAVDETPARVNDDPFLSRIANRFSQERAARGEMGDVAPGQGYNTEDIVSRGLKMSPEEVNQHVSDIMRDQGNDPMAQGAAVRAEEARLSDRSTELSRVSEANPTNLAARQAANAAFQDLTDFHNGPVAKLKQRFHASGIALQREIPVDLSTFNGLREKWLKDNGKAPPASMEPTFRRTAENVRRVTAEENATVSRLGQEIEKATRGKKLPSAEEVRLRIAERMKDLPCRV